MADVFEYRGVDNLYVAEVTKDDATGYTCEAPIYLAPVATVEKATDSASEAHYYDNKALIVINSESADSITITMAPPVLAKLAKITGRSFDEGTGMMVDSIRQNKYFALMYRTKGSDGAYRYVSRLKGSFNIPTDTHNTENDSTDATNTQITYTGIYTQYEFNKGIYDGSNWSKGSAKGIVVDTRYNAADVTNFFSSVQTPDTIEGTGTTVTGVGLAPSTLALTVGDEAQLTATVMPTSAIDQAVTYSSSSDSVATVTAAGKVKAIGAGTATITVTTHEGSYTDTCAVTVTAAT